MRRPDTTTAGTRILNVEDNLTCRPAGGVDCRYHHPAMRRPPWRDRAHARPVRGLLMIFHSWG